MKAEEAGDEEAIVAAEADWVEAMAAEQAAEQAQQEAEEAVRAEAFAAEDKQVGDFLEHMNEMYEAHSPGDHHCTKNKKMSDCICLSMNYLF